MSSGACAISEDPVRSPTAGDTGAPVAQVIALLRRVGVLADAPDQPQRWVRLPIDRWSLATLGVPIYPQDRFQLGVALAIARDARLDRGIRVDLRSTADRYTGAREREVLLGRPALLRAADRFFFSAIPR